jgi:glycosyltransferase involved in cell wall biosynthesis
MLSGENMAARIALVAHWDWVLYNFRLPLAKALRAQGADVAFICPVGEYTPRLRAEGFKVLHWRLRRRSFSPPYEGAAIAHLAWIYRRNTPTCVQHFTIKPALYGSLAARIAGVPRVFNAFTGLGFTFSDASASRRIRAIVRPLLRRVLCRRNSITLFQNAYDRDLFVRSRLVPVEQTCIIPGSGVDTERFKPRQNGQHGHAGPIVLLAARLILDKGIAEFVKAAQLVSHAGMKCRFWVAGTPDPGNPSRVPDETLEEWRRQGVVEFLGHRDDMPELLRQVDIAVLPTSYPEGVPRFLLEAAATGLPLVASDIESCRLVVRDGVNGLLVPPRDAAALAQAVLRLAQDPAVCRRMGEASRAIAVRQFGEDLIIQQYLKLYEEQGAI